MDDTEDVFALTFTQFSKKDLFRVEGVRLRKPAVRRSFIAHQPSRKLLIEPFIHSTD